MPLPDWLHHLGKGIKKHGKDKLFGARILDTGNSIFHAGLLIDQNHSPVCAYQHVPADFPQALKERPFMMLDHFLGINLALFLKIGGFWKKTGKFLFMDLCLRTDTFNRSKNNCIYLPNVGLVALDTHNDGFSLEDSTWFYGRWHGNLWENQEAFYAADQVTKSDLDAARLSQSMTRANLLD